MQNCPRQLAMQSCGTSKQIEKKNTSQIKAVIENLNSQSYIKISINCILFLVEGNITSCEHFEPSKTVYINFYIIFQ